MDDRFPLTMQKSKQQNKLLYQSLDGAAEAVQHASMLPTAGFTLTWHNLNVHVLEHKDLKFWRRQPRVEAKKILDSASGVARPGQLLAILGASGSGKTTLLNALNGRSGHSLAVKGEIFVNGVSATSSMVKVSGYVRQQDLFFETMTVREQLVFQAMLRMGKDVAVLKRMERVDDVIQQVGLEKCAETLIGCVASGGSISGGQRKRLAFACEVLADPPLLFCDEPTSGLDSFTAETVVTTMRRLASSGKTVVCTIHQPPSEIYEMFDRVYLLAEGRLAFAGGREDALSFFKSTGFACPVHHNPPDYFMRVLAIHPGRVQESDARISTVCDAFQRSSYHAALESDTDTNKSDLPSGDLLIDSYPSKASWFGQFEALLWRSWINVKRQSLLIRVRFFQYLIFGLLTGLLYAQLQLTQTGIVDINGLMFFMLMFVVTTSIFNVTVVFPLEFPTFQREYLSGMYRAPIYFVAKVIAEMPGYFLLPTMLCVIVYWIAGLNPLADRFFTFTAVTVLTANAATSFAYALSCLIPKAALVQAVMQPMQHMFMLVGGFFHHLNTVPGYLIWLQSFSWYSYAHQVLMVNQWSGIESIACPQMSNGTELPCYKNGAAIMAQFGVREENVPVSVCMLFVLLLLWQIIAAGFLQLRVNYF